MNAPLSQYDQATVAALQERLDGETVRVLRDHLATARTHIIRFIAKLHDGLPIQNVPPVAGVKDMLGDIDRACLDIADHVRIFDRTFEATRGALRAKRKKPAKPSYSPDYSPDQLCRALGKIATVSKKESVEVNIQLVRRRKKP
jgi:histidinol-phosphate/aromatic aminotransferase/cobyric acid decarboxylase-like protein